jgi:hypothetical protein
LREVWVVFGSAQSGEEIGTARREEEDDSHRDDSKPDRRRSKKIHEGGDLATGLLIPPSLFYNHSDERLRRRSPTNSRLPAQTENQHYPAEDNAKPEIVPDSNDNTCQVADKLTGKATYSRLTRLMPVGGVSKTETLLERERAEPRGITSASTR